MYNIKALKRITRAELHFYSVVDELNDTQLWGCLCGSSWCASVSCDRVDWTGTWLLLRLISLYSCSSPLDLRKVTLISQVLEKGQSTEHGALGYFFPFSTPGMLRLSSVFALMWLRVDKNFELGFLAASISWKVLWNQLENDLAQIINANSVFMSDKHIFSEQILMFDYGKIKLNSFSSSVSAQISQGLIANPME